MNAWSPVDVSLERAQWTAMSSTASAAVVTVGNSGSFLDVGTRGGSSASITSANVVYRVRRLDPPPDSGVREPVLR